MHTEEESDGAESPKKREDEADPKQPLAGRYPIGPFIDLGDLFVLDGITIHAERLLIGRRTASVWGSRVTEGPPCRGTSSNDDTVKFAPSRKARWNRKSG
jgi:hypothetical protein